MTQVKTEYTLSLSLSVITLCMYLRLLRALDEGLDELFRSNVIESFLIGGERDQ